MATVVGKFSDRECLNGPALGDVPYAVRMESHLVAEFFAKN